MRISSRSAILILSLLAISLITSVVSHSASGLTETNKSGAAASEGDLTTKNVTQKIDNHDSKNKDGTGDKVQKHSTKPDVKPIKEKVKSEIKDHFKLPIDIPFP